MKKPSNFVLVGVGAMLVALGFAGWRMWGSQANFNRVWPELSGGTYDQPVEYRGLQYLVPPDELYDSGSTAEDRPALTNPDYVDISSADPKLADELKGIAVSVGNTHLFYPFQILNWHQIVMDYDVNGEPLIVTYSPLSGSAVVYSAWVNQTHQEQHGFIDAGQVYNNGLLLDDGDGTVWNQTTGQAIVGKTVGQKLEIYPSSVMTWDLWKDNYPNGLVLSTETGYARDYGRHPFASYETSPGIFFPLNYVHPGVGPKDTVYRLDHQDLSMAFLLRYLPRQTDPNVTLGTDGDALRAVVFYYGKLNNARIFNRDINGGSRTLTFTYANGTITDNETGSRWSPEGVALSGELRGTALEELPVTQHYGFAYFAMYPKSLISGADLLPSSQVVDEPEVLEIK